MVEKLLERLTITTTYTVEENTEATGIISSENKDIVFLVTPTSVTETVMRTGTVTEKVVLKSPNGEETLYEGIVDVKVNLVNEKEGTNVSLDKFTTESFDYGTVFKHGVEIPKDRVEVKEVGNKKVTTTYTYSIKESEKSVTIDSERTKMSFVIYEVITVTEEPIIEEPIVEEPTTEEEVPNEDVEIPTDEVEVPTPNSKDVEEPKDEPIKENSEIQIIEESAKEEGVVVEDMTVSTLSVLPNTGQSESKLSIVGLLLPLSLLGIYSRKRKEEK